MRKKQIVLKFECSSKREERREIITALSFLRNENIPLSLIHCSFLKDSKSEKMGPIKPHIFKK